MTKSIKRIINLETQEVTEIEFTKAELDASAAEQLANEQAATEKAAAKAALLARLGITADEAALLIK